MEKQYSTHYLTEKYKQHYSLRATDRFIQPFSLEFLGVLEHLGRAIDVIYVGQLPPVWGICGNALSQFPQI